MKVVLIIENRYSYKIGTKNRMYSACRIAFLKLNTPYLIVEYNTHVVVAVRLSLWQLVNVSSLMQPIELEHVARVVRACESWH